MGYLISDHCIEKSTHPNLNESGHDRFTRRRNISMYVHKYNAMIALFVDANWVAVSPKNHIMEGSQSEI